MNMFKTVHLLRYKPAPFARRIVTKPRKMQSIVPVRASLSEVLIYQSEIIGRGLIAFVLFASTMNWWYYRRTREEIEKQQKDKE